MEEALTLQVAKIIAVPAEVLGVILFSCRTVYTVALLHNDFQKTDTTKLVL